MLLRLWRQSRLHLILLFEKSQKWIEGIIRAGQAALSAESSLIAASIGYFTLFSLFPLTLLTVAIASLWFDPLLAENEIVTQLEFVAPALSELLGANIQQIVQARGPVTGFAFITLLWSASNIFNVLTRAMDRIWAVGVNRSALRHRGLAILMAVIISGVLLIASFAEGILLTIINALPEDLQSIQPFAALSNQLWATLVSTVLFSLLYYFLPHVSLTWRDVLPGAFGAGLLWELAKDAFLYFVSNYLSRSNLVYGSVATITAFLTWTYVSSIIFLFGGYLNVEYARLKNGKGRGAIRR